MMLHYVKVFKKIVFIITMIPYYILYTQYYSILRLPMKRNVKLVELKSIQKINKLFSFKSTK